MTDERSKDYQLQLSSTEKGLIMRKLEGAVNQIVESLARSSGLPSDKLAPLVAAEIRKWSNDVNSNVIATALNEINSPTRE